jgi:hypothetical protein
MSESKFTVPTEMVDLPSKGLLYPKDSPLASGQIEIKYMTAREEDILTNANLLRQGLAIERMLKSIIKTPISFEDLILGDRNAILIAARILAYGKDYSFNYFNPNTMESEVVKGDLQSVKYKTVNTALFNEKNEFSFELPFTKNTITFKALTVAEDRKIDEEMKGMKKNLGEAAPGLLTTKLKHQITSVNGDYSTKTVRDFIDSGALLSKDSLPLRKYIESIIPDIDSQITFTTKGGEEVTTDMPMTAEFFFPGSGI